MGRLKYSTDDINSKLEVMDNFQDKQLVVEINDQSTNDNIPSAKAVYDFTTIQINAKNGENIKVSENNNSSTIKSYIDNEIDKVDKKYEIKNLTFYFSDSDPITYKIACEKDVEVGENNES